VVSFLQAIYLYIYIYIYIYMRVCVGVCVITIITISSSSRMDLQEVGCGYVDWIGLAQDRDRWRTLVSAVMNLRVPLNAWNFLTSCKPVSFSRRTLHHGVSK